MRTLYILSAIYIGFALTSCSLPYQTQNATCPSQDCYTHCNKKNYKQIKIYTKSKPTLPYQVVGEETISQFNSSQTKCQAANLRDGMKELALAMGGDAIIDIRHHEKMITGTVIAFKKDTSVLL